MTMAGREYWDFRTRSLDQELKLTGEGDETQRLALNIFARVKEVIFGLCSVQSAEQVGNVVVKDHTWQDAQEVFSSTTEKQRREDLCQQSIRMLNGLPQALADLHTASPVVHDLLLRHCEEPFKSDWPAVLSVKVGDSSWWNCWSGATHAPMGWRAAQETSSP